MQDQKEYLAQRDGYQVRPERYIAGKGHRGLRVAYTSMESYINGLIHQWTHTSMDSYVHSHFTSPIMMIQPLSPNPWT